MQVTFIEASALRFRRRVRRTGLQVAGIETRFSLSDLRVKARAGVVLCTRSRVGVGHVLFQGLDRLAYGKFLWLARERARNVPVNVSVPEINGENVSGTGTGTDTFTG